MTAMEDVYTHGHQDSVLRSHRWRTAENSAAYLLPLLEPGMSLLDVGCGPGTLTADLAMRVSPGPVLGVDVDAGVIDEARGHAETLRPRNLSFIRGDFRTLGLPPGSFDVVHAHQMLQHLRDPVGALEEMGRLARPGAVIAVRDCDYSATMWAPEEEGLARWLRLYLAVTRRNGAEANAGRWLLHWAHKAGLRSASYTTSTWTFSSPEDRQWWGGLWADRVVGSTFAEQAVGYGLATPDELVRISDGWRAWAAQPDGIFVLVHGEVIARV